MQQSKRPYLIAITGNIGSGKTYVTNMLKHFCKIYYADDIAKAIIQTNRIIDLLINRWGSAILKEDSTLNFEEIAKIVFTSHEELVYLNSILHPAVKKEIQKITEESHDEYLIFEIPLLFETQYQDFFDFIILVYSSKTTRIQRTMQRNNITEDEVLGRMRNQIDDELKIDIVDYIIYTENKPISNQIQDLIELIKTKPRRNSSQVKLS